MHWGVFGLNYLSKPCFQRYIYVFLPPLHGWNIAGSRKTLFNKSINMFFFFLQQCRIRLERSPVMRNVWCSNPNPNPNNQTINPIFFLFKNKPKPKYCDLNSSMFECTQRRLKVTGLIRRGVDLVVEIHPMVKQPTKIFDWCNNW